MQFTLDDVRLCFEKRTYELGAEYERDGHVLRLEMNKPAGFVEASVRGSMLIPYEVSVDIKTSRYALSITGTCDCSVEFNCKHAAAAAIAAAKSLSRNNTTSETRATPRRFDPSDRMVDNWLLSLTTQSAALREQTREHIRYIIDLSERDALPKMHLVPRVVSSLKNGELSMGRAIDLRKLSLGIASYLKPVDRMIGRLLNVAQIGNNQGLSPELMAVLLDRLVATGRLHWQSTKNPPLTRNDLGRQGLDWHLDEEGRQHAGIEGRPAVRLFPAVPLWYLDPDRYQAGTLDFGIVPQLAAKIVMAPRLSQEQAERAQTVWHRIFANDGVPAPQSSVRTEVVEHDPIPVLQLRGFTATTYVPPVLEPLAAVAELTFAYGDASVRPSEKKPELRDRQSDCITIWPRRREFETEMRGILDACGLVPIDWPYSRSVDRKATILSFQGSSEQRWAQFLDVTVPALREHGWRIDVDPSFPYELVRADEWDAEIQQSEHHWFELDIGIEVGGERLALLPIIVDALRALGIRSGEQLAEGHDGASVYGKLPNGTFVALPAARVSRILSALVELYDTPLSDEGRLALTPAHVGSLEQLDRATPIRWATAEPLRALVRALADASALEGVALPATFAGELRPYQAHGVAWLQLLRRNGFGGVLADDMGLGKTVQLLAHVSIEKARKRLRGPVLIVAPTSVVPNWQAEIARFTPRLKVLSLTGAKRSERFSMIARSDVVLTTYALLHRDIERLSQLQWKIVALDEAQAIKNPRSKGSHAVGRLQAEQRLALTGTPMENHLDELWSIFSFALPGLLGDRTSFGRTFRTPIEKHGDAERRAVLASRLRPFLLRRTKESVALDLPEKTEIVTRVELSGGQRDLYETIRVAMHERVRKELQRRGVARSRIVVLDALLKLRQVCCDPRLLRIPAARKVRESQKLEALLDMLPELVEEGRRILLFSQFTSMLDLIKPELASRGITFVEIRGETKDRATPVQRFQAGEVPLFLISLKAGGTGLNLTAADTVIHYDPWWNPAVERQATDRAHRIGQHRPVFVYKLVTSGTVEERILEMQQRKAELAAALFQESAAAKLDVEEIDRLFAPL